MTSERKAKNALNGFLREIGPSKAVERFLSGYGNTRTKSSYSCELALYFRWLKGKGMDLNPDALITDDLKCVYESKPTDVSAKRRHTDLLSEYVNICLVQHESSDSRRSLAAAAIRSFYESVNPRDSGRGARHSSNSARVPRGVALCSCAAMVAWPGHVEGIVT